MRVKMLCMFFLLGFAGRLTAAPTETIRGRVVDQLTGKPLAGVTVTIKGKKGGVATNEDGWFTLNLPSERAVLVISSIGYTSVEQVVEAGSTNIVISLVQDQKGMGEVVVTALGIQRTAKSLTYAAQRVGGDQINEVRDASFANTLSGKVAGLTITPSANGPGGATRVLLRGNRSIQGNNNALIVVDGVAIDNQAISGEVKDDAGSTNAGQSGSDGLSNINPDDIESMSVLKGAAGAALYGSRAANGVIMITTKKGRAGRMSVSLNSGVSAEKAFSIPEMQDQYSQGTNGAYTTNTGYSWGEKVTGQSVTDWRGKTVNLRTYPDNIKNFFRTAVSTNNAIGVTAGSDKIQSYLSYANNNATGIVPGNRLMRNTFNGRFNINITDRLSADAKVSYIVQDIYNKPGIGGDGLVAANVYSIPTSVNQNDLKTYKTVDVCRCGNADLLVLPNPIR
jgi:TonB-dependent SusC/RagA subfamily outer membrane receptor